MAERLRNKVAIVTGGASGFGMGIVECFAREGAVTVIADLNPETGEATARRVAKSGGKVAFRKMDVTDSASVRDVVDGCVADHGRIDIMVANAGLGQRPCPIEATTDESFERQFAVNVKGVFHCCKHVTPHFRTQGSGNIVITASGIALTPRPNLVVYGASKGAVLTFAKGLAVELAPDGIRVNALCPAAGDTPMLAEFMGGQETPEGRERFVKGLPLGKLIQPRDMGNAAVFLASDEEAGALTGVALPVDSGRCI